MDLRRALGHCKGPIDNPKQTHTLSKSASDSLANLHVCRDRQCNSMKVYFHKDTKSQQEAKIKQIANSAEAIFEPIDWTIRALLPATLQHIYYQQQLPSVLQAELFV